MLDQVFDGLLEMLVMLFIPTRADNTTKFPDDANWIGHGFAPEGGICWCSMWRMRNAFAGAFPALAALSAITQES